MGVLPQQWPTHFDNHGSLLLLFRRWNTLWVPWQGHSFHSWNCRRCLRSWCEIKIFSWYDCWWKNLCSQKFPAIRYEVGNKNTAIITSNTIPLHWFLPHSVAYHLLHLPPSLLQRVSVDLSRRCTQSAVPLGRVHLWSWVPPHKLLYLNVHWQLLRC